MVCAPSRAAGAPPARPPKICFSLKGDGSLSIYDNGRGMSHGVIGNSLRAGWTDSRATPIPRSNRPLTLVDMVSRHLNRHGMGAMLHPHPLFNV